jgi:hypothetical protein
MPPSKRALQQAPRRLWQVCQGHKAEVLRTRDIFRKRDGCGGMPHRSVSHRTRCRRTVRRAIVLQLSISGRTEAWRIVLLSLFR